ncbi:MAG: hypothetical protein DME19_13925 [Verrucomicrobia bacterium]|nr:MAG: hypothetical protein DME19_13925 [Verrucomicrobiota bacterium]
MTETSNANAIASFQQLALELKDTQSSSEHIHVLRLTDPKNYNPFSVCGALLQNTTDVWGVHGAESRSSPDCSSRARDYSSYKW